MTRQQMRAERFLRAKFGPMFDRVMRNAKTNAMAMHVNFDEILPNGVTLGNSPRAVVQLGLHRLPVLPGEPPFSFPRHPVFAFRSERGGFIAGEAK